MNSANERKQYLPNSDSIIYSPLQGNEYSLFADRLRNNYTLGVDYYINPKHVLSYEAKFSLSPVESNVIDSKYNVDIFSDSTVLNFLSLSKLEESTNTFDNSLFYIANFNSRNVLNVSYAFSVFDNVQHNIIQNGEESVIQLTTNARLFSTLNIDYTKTISTKLNWNIGYGNTYKDVKNSFVSEFNLTDTNQDFMYSDLRNQLYTYLSYKPGEKLGFKFGVAAENSSISSQGIKTGFNILLPHVDINYKPIKVMDISLKYRASSNYPSISQTNPFEIVNDLQTVTIGNPELQPSTKNTFSTRISFMGGALAAELYYTYTDNLIISTIESRDDGMWVNSFKNAGNYKNKGIKGNITIPFGKSLFLQSSADIYSESINYSGEIKKLNDWSLTSQLIYRNNKHKTILGLLYQNELTKRLSWIGYSHNGNDFWSILLMQPMLNENLSVMLLYVIPTEFGVSYNQGSYINTPLYEEYNNIDLQMVKNMIMFRVSYRFSDGKSAKKLEKNIEI